MTLRKNRILFGIAVICSTVFLSCASEKKKTVMLYNVDSLISTQINYLLRHEAAINKRAMLNGVEKVTTTNPKDSIDWTEELAIFFELGVVNKPIHRTTYTVQTLADDKSNLSVKSFTTTEDLPVKYLKVYYQDSMDQLRKIEAQYDEANALYSSKRLLTMEFENIYNQTILTSYSVAGGQKMFLDDSVRYIINANVALKK